MSVLLTAVGGNKENKEGQEKKTQKDQKLVSLLQVIHLGGGLAQW